MPHRRVNPPTGAIIATFSERDNPERIGSLATAVGLLDEGQRTAVKLSVFEMRTERGSHVESAPG